MKIIVNCTDYKDVTNPNCRYKYWSMEYNSDYIPRIGEWVCVEDKDSDLYTHNRKITGVHYHISNGVVNYVEINTEEKDCTS